MRLITRDYGIRQKPGGRAWERGYMRAHRQSGLKSRLRQWRNTDVVYEHLASYMLPTLVSGFSLLLSRLLSVSL